MSQVEDPWHDACLQVVAERTHHDQFEGVAGESQRGDLEDRGISMVAGV